MTPIHTTIMRCSSLQTILLSLAGGIAATGCGPSRPPRLAAPALNPAAVAAAAGDPESLAAVQANRGAFDTNQDGSVSPEELTNWLTVVRDSRVAITSVALQFRQRGRPLANLAVKLVPEDCMGGRIAVAEGTTDDSGICMATIPAAEVPGVNCGLYRVELTGPGIDGRPLPASFNTESRLGLAVGAALPPNGMATFDLK